MNAPEQTPDVPTQRGQLKYSIRTSSSHVECGTQFSIAVEINNPFEVPVTIKSVATKLPTEFIDVSSEQLRMREDELRTRMQNVIATKFKDVQESTDAKQRAIGDLTKEILRTVPLVGSALATGTSVAQYIRASTPTTASILNEASDAITAEDIQRVAAKATGTENDAEAVRAELVAIMQEKAKALTDRLHQSVTLQPGNSTVQVFTLRTDRAVMFRPATYNLDIEVEYQTDGSSQVDVVNYALAIASSMQSMCWGAVLGSVLGTAARGILDSDSNGDIELSINSSAAIRFIATLVVNVILGVIAIVVFARKRDVQPMLSIEDFWGSLLIGFLVGYNGESFFSQLLPSSTEGVIETPTPNAG